VRVHASARHQGRATGSRVGLEASNRAAPTLGTSIHKNLIELAEDLGRDTRSGALVHGS